MANKMNLSWKKKMKILRELKMYREPFKASSKSN